MSSPKRHRIYHVKVVKEGRPVYLTALHSPIDAVGFFRDRIGRSVFEHLMVLFLNNRNVPLGWREVSRGGVAAASIHPRDVFIPALKMASSRIIMAHNHPGGHCEPSPEDITLTNHISETGQLIGIELVDHLIITDDDFLSLREAGKITR